MRFLGFFRPQAQGTSANQLAIVTLRYMKELAIIGLLLGVMTACKPQSAGIAPHPASSSTKPLRIGAYFWPGSFWIDVAWKKGWFEEAGLAVVRVDSNADYFKSFDDLVHGDLDTVGFTLFDLILYDAKGSDIVGVLNSDISFGADALVVRSGISSLKDLYGKKIGLPKGTYLEFMLDIIARRDGMKATDFDLVDIAAENADKVLASGKVDAVMTWEPIASLAVEAVKGKRLFTTADLPGVSGGLFAFRREFLDTRPEDVQRFVNVWNRTTEFIASNRKEAFAIVAEVNHKSVAVVEQFATGDKVLDRRGNELAFSYASGFDSLHGTWRQMNDFMLERKLVKERLESQAFLDARFLMALK